MNIRAFKTSDISDIAVCLAAEKREKRSLGELRMIDEILATDFPGCPEKVIWSAMERSERKGLLDCGTNLRGGWLTEKGRSLLRGYRNLLK